MSESASASSDSDPGRRLRLESPLRASARARAAIRPLLTALSISSKTSSSSKLHSLLESWGFRSRDEAPLLFSLASSERSIHRAFEQDPDGSLLLVGDLMERARLSCGEADRVFRAPAQMRSFSALHLACYWDFPAAVSALLRRGFNPSFFSGQVTPTGLAAYSGSARALGALAIFGADLRLTLDPAHLAEGSASHAAGSTLLHRIMDRSYIARRPLLSQILLASGQYSDPLPRALNGQTPLDWLPEHDPEADSIRSILLGEVARLEQSQIEASALGARRASTRPKPL